MFGFYVNFEGNLGNDAKPDKVGTRDTIKLRVAVAQGKDIDPVWVDVDAPPFDSVRALKKGQRVVVRGRYVIKPRGDGVGFFHDVRAHEVEVPFEPRDKDKAPF